VPRATNGSPEAGGQGRLAEVLASRGGQAAPEAPFVIEHREALIYMLCEAAELEHGIMCQYLFAAFSLKQRTDEGLSEEELAVVTRWRKAVAHVATEEMLHLALVHNLLSSVGAAPHFGRPNLPAPAHHYPAGVNLTLVPFGEQALQHFMFLERPEGMELEGAEGIDAPIHDAVPLMAEGDIVPQLQDFATVGHLYRSIEQGLAHLSDKFGESNLFVGPSRAQASRDHFQWPELVAVTDLATAQKALDTILEQGEGARGQWQQAHFGQFVQILDEYRAMCAANPQFDPVRPVMFATVRSGERNTDTPRIADPLTARCADLFNVSYEILLQMFERYFAHTEETDAQLSTLADATVALMLQVLRPLGGLITTLPVGDAFPGMNAGPSFELFYEDDYLMPHREAAWALLEERLRDTVTFCQNLQGSADERVGGELSPVADALTGIADSLAAHFADWGAKSRFAGADRQDGAAAPETGGAAGDGVARGVALAGQAAAALPNDGGLGPLIDALSAAGPDDVSSAAWELAKATTKLRADWPGDAETLTVAMQAAAELQDLAVTLADSSDGPDSADARLAALSDLQAPCAQEIRCAPDGPYLVTGADRVTDWLGAPMPARPQMALCRCGASARKPDCDGACVETGFTDAKDPGRVPDQRDTYPGVQLTVFDNRGICQHSGFCTDRLNTVFHTEGPFVTPSGGRMDEIIRAVRDCPSGALSYAIDGVEARSQVDWENAREPAIEVSKDGPYRIIGAIPLVDAAGEPVARAEGSSLEHYALCRCGHSQNKPFCSGMHWYVDFKDPVPDPEASPTLFEWAGGLPALTRMTRLFYEKHVPTDPLLAPVFANMAPDHPRRVARWLGEVFGGPKLYSASYGGYRRMISQHLGKGLTEEMRARWVQLLCRSAEEALLPADAEFQAAFRAYLEWGSRIAVENSQPDAKPPPHMPMPRWWWVCDATPGSRISALEPAADSAEAEAAATVELPGPDEPIEFEAHIKPLFRERDRRSMKFAFDLWSRDDVRQHAEAILDQVKGGTMPCDGAWPAEWVSAFERWIADGMH
jgi:CDGSH-type Zn-finger protein/truncated hemoglobin YjbI